MDQPMWVERQAVEIFHLQFLRVFGTRVDKNLYALKGGGNLRFFYRSIRFSEDIDLDLAGISVGENVEAHTKIDFSRRGLDEGTAYGPIDAEFIQRYRIFPVLVRHYTPEAGFKQKINALASRKNTQARDVFDLKLLMDAGAGKEPLPEGFRKLLPQAIECAMGVGYDAFISQVFSYLEPEHQEHYRERAVWEVLQSQVVEALEGLQR
jgi:hypothetical protein